VKREDRKHQRGNQQNRAQHGFHDSSPLLSIKQALRAIRRRGRRTGIDSGQADRAHAARRYQAGFRLNIIPPSSSPRLGQYSGVGEGLQAVSRLERARPGTGGYAVGIRRGED
jgi:hypothetical protein